MARNPYHDLKTRCKLTWVFTAYNFKSSARGRQVLAFSKAPIYSLIYRLSNGVLSKTLGGHVLVFVYLNKTEGGSNDCGLFLLRQGCLKQRNEFGLDLLLVSMGRISAWNPALRVLVQESPNYCRAIRTQILSCFDEPDDGWPTVITHLVNYFIIMFKLS